MKKDTKRMKADAYPTPPWCVDRLLEVEDLDLPGGEWLEPGGGTGNIIRAVSAKRADVKWHTVEVRRQCQKGLVEAVGQADRVAIGDFLQMPVPKTKYKVAFTNPPFSLAREFVEKSLHFADRVVMLLRLAFLETDTRADFLRGNMPDVYVLPDRPSFVNGGHDYSAYAWFVWSHVRKDAGKLRILASTPEEIRYPRSKKRRRKIGK